MASVSGKLMCYQSAERDKSRHGGQLTGSSNADGLGNGQNLRVLQQTGVGGKAGIDPLSGREETESVPTAVAVAGRSNLVNATRLEVGHPLGEDGVDSGRAVK